MLNDANIKVGNIDELKTFVSQCHKYLDGVKEIQKTFHRACSNVAMTWKDRQFRKLSEESIATINEEIKKIQKVQEDLIEFLKKKEKAIEYR